MLLLAATVAVVAVPAAFAKAAFPETIPLPTAGSPRASRSGGGRPLRRLDPHRGDLPRRPPHRPGCAPRPGRGGTAARSASTSIAAAFSWRAGMTGKGFVYDARTGAARAGGAARDRRRRDLCERRRRDDAGSMVHGLEPRRAVPAPAVEERSPRRGGAGRPAHRRLPARAGVQPERNRRDAERQDARRRPERDTGSLFTVDAATRRHARDRPRRRAGARTATGSCCSAARSTSCGTSDNQIAVIGSARVSRRAGRRGRSRARASTSRPRSTARHEALRGQRAVPDAATPTDAVHGGAGPALAGEEAPNPLANGRRLVEPRHVPGAVEELELAARQEVRDGATRRPIRRGPPSRRPSASAVRLAASSSVVEGESGPVRVPSTIARTIVRSWRIDGLATADARHSTNSSGIRPASRLAPCPDLRSIERTRAGLFISRIITAPAGDAISLMIPGTPASGTSGPPPSSTIRPTRTGCERREPERPDVADRTADDVRSLKRPGRRAFRAAGRRRSVRSSAEKSMGVLSPQPGGRGRSQRKPASSGTSDAHEPGPTVPWTSSTGSPEPTSRTRRRQRGESTSTKVSRRLQAVVAQSFLSFLEEWCRPRLGCGHRCRSARHGSHPLFVMTPRTLEAPRGRCPWGVLPMPTRPCSIAKSAAAARVETPIFRRRSGCDGQRSSARCRGRAPPASSADHARAGRRPRLALGQPGRAVDRGEPVGRRPRARRRRHRGRRVPLRPRGGASRSPLG